MTIATSNRTGISIIKESTPGVTPATPALKKTRYTGESLKANLTTTVSEEIRDDRATADLIPTDQSNAGDINIELSGGTYDELFEGLLYADTTWTVAQTVAKTTLAAVVDGFSDSANGMISSLHLNPGQFIKASGFANAGLNIVYQVLTVTAGAITTSPAPIATEAAGASAFLKGSTIKSGVTDHSYTIVKDFNDLATPAKLIFRGMRVGSLKLDLATGAIAKGSFSFMGQSSEITTAGIAGSTYVDASTTAIMNCVSDVTSIIAIGEDIDDPLQFTELSFSYDNKLRELKAIGRLGSVDIRPGTIEAKATTNPYFESIELLEAFLANKYFTLAVMFVGSDGYGYVFSYPRVKFLSQEIVAGSKDQDMIIKGEVQAIIDPTTAAMRIDRFAP